MAQLHYVEDDEIKSLCAKLDVQLVKYTRMQSSLASSNFYTLTIRFPVVAAAPRDERSDSMCLRLGLRYFIADHSFHSLLAVALDQAHTSGWCCRCRGRCTVADCGISSFSVDVWELRHRTILVSLSPDFGREQVSRSLPHSSLHLCSLVGLPKY